MELWNWWTTGLQSALNLLVANGGLSEAIAIVALTLIARMLLMPISLTAAFRIQKNKSAIDQLKPKLEELRKTFKDNPAELAARTMQLYRDNGIALFDKLSLLNIGTQGLFGIGMYQCLKRAVFDSKFLWIASLAKPDFLITALITILMLLSALLMPDAMANTSTLLLVAVPILISVIAIATLPSALGIYWATSNAVTLFQTLVVRTFVAKRLAT